MHALLSLSSCLGTGNYSRGGEGGGAQYGKIEGLKLFAPTIKTGLNFGCPTLLKGAVDISFVHFLLLDIYESARRANRRW